VALVLGVVHLLLRPDSGTDLAAQLARASFARAAPLTPVDLSWYAGTHPFGYSLLAPWVMAVLGVALSGLLAAVAASVLFARLLRDSERPMLASVVGAVFIAADVASGRTTFALGAVTALAALVLLPRLRWAALFAVLTALLSPVAAAFLGFAAAVLVLHRKVGGWTVGVASSMPVVLLAVLFPGGGIQPFSGDSALPAVFVAVVLAVLTTVPEVRTGALLYADRTELTEPARDGRFAAADRAGEADSDGLPEGDFERIQGARSSSESHASSAAASAISTSASSLVTRRSSMKLDCTAGSPIASSR